MAGQAKEQIDELEFKLNSAIEELNIAASTELANKRVIFGKIKNVQNTFEKLMRAHLNYCGKAKIDVGSTESTE
jgi:hypothetical protein